MYTSFITAIIVKFPRSLNPCNVYLLLQHLSYIITPTCPLCDSLARAFFDHKLFQDGNSNQPIPALSCFMRS